MCRFFLVVFGVVATACSSSSVEGPSSPAAPDAGETPIAEAGAVCGAAQSTPDDCCGVVCAAAPHAQATCTRQKCSITCDDGRSDCDRNPANGCETATASDPANCGACGRSCGAAACVAGVCGPTTMVSATGAVTEIRVEGADLFWTERASGTGQLTFYRCPVARCQAPYEVVYQPTDGASAFEVDATDFLFFEGTKLRRCPRTGACVPTDVLEDPDRAISEIALDATYVYWMHAALGPLYGRVRRADRSGSNVYSVADGNPSARSFADLRVFGSNVYFDDIGGVGRKHFLCSVNGCPGGVPVATYPEIGGTNLGGRYVDDSGMYIAQFGQMWRGPVNGGTAVRIGAGFVNVGGDSITGTASTIYWTAGATGDIFSLTKGSVKPEYYRTKLGKIGLIQAAGGFLYFASDSGARISRIAL